MGKTLADGFTGALLGLMTGDALGRSAKDHTAESLHEHAHFGTEMIGGFYTEDTEMAINVAESLLAQGSIDPDDLVHRLSERLTPMRGYNPGDLEVLYRLQQGMDWRDAGRTVFEDGSYGAGGSARATPVGLMYHDDPDALIPSAALSARVTHAHPIGQAGAVTVALAVSHALGNAPPRDMFERVLGSLAGTEYAGILPNLEPLPDLLADGDLAAPDIAQRLDTRLTVQACVPAALYSVLRHPDSFEQAVTLAVRLGGDTDTVAAIAGAVAGAYHGRQAIPARWLDRLENEARGRDAVRDLGEQLYAAWQNRPR